MALRIVIVGPGRVGLACARRLRANGVPILGFLGRDAERTRRASAEVGVGDVLAWRDLARAHVVLFAVGDGDLPGAVQAAAAAAPPRPCSLWLHTSARHGLAVFAGVPGIRRGAIHPVAPFADGEAGAQAMRGAFGLVVGEPSAQRLLQRLCALLDLVPIAGSDGDRALYHAACALAANGLTALFAAAEQAMAAAGVVAPGQERALLAALMQAALAGCRELGPAAALSGPVRRGDAATVALHLQRLRERAPEALPAYLATARGALALARQGGLDPALADAVALVLARP